MHRSVLDFAEKMLSPARVAGKRVLEVGSFNVNGSVRDIVVRSSPLEYIGIDLQPQEGYVDIVMDAGSLVRRFGSGSFDVVVCAEMLEHAEDWRGVIQQMTAVLAPGGLIFITTRSNGFPIHGFPSDHWRFSTEDMAGMFPRYGTRYLGDDPDPERPGVFYVGTKPPFATPPPEPSKVRIGYHSQPAFDERMRRRRADPAPPESLKVFHHVACMGNWEKVFADQIGFLRSVGLAPECHVVGPEPEFHMAGRIAAGFDCKWRGPDLLQYETPTLQSAWEWARANPGSAVLYLHTKGVSQPDDGVKQAWRIIMEEALVRPWEDNLSALAEFDMAGLDWMHSRDHPHYCGNFWMARCDWLASLRSPDAYRAQGGPWIAGNPWERMHAELWIGSEPWHHMKSLVCENTDLWYGTAAFELLDTTGRERLNRFNR